jgi:MYXO-CTERM domain-containing protein
MKLYLASLLVASSASAATYHVAPNGNDAADGSTPTPWATIQHAADRVHPGDTVLVSAGTYSGFVVSASGNATARITFTGDGAVNIDGAATANRDAIEVDGGYVTIQGFTVTHAARAGISVITSDHVTIRNNKTDQNAKWGIFTAFANDVDIENNEASRSGAQHGIYDSNASDGAVIRGNKVWGNAMCGIHMNGDISQGGNGLITNALVENNYIYDNGTLGGSAINGDGVQHATIRNNVLDGNHASGVSLYQIDAAAPSIGNVVVNNTIRMATNARFAINIQDGSTNNTLVNNILLDAAPNRGAIDIDTASLPGLVSDHNTGTDAWSIDGTVSTLAAWKSRTGGDAHSFVATEAQLFATGKLELRDGSPAIDAGQATDAPATDFAGTARPQGAGFDIGAYEHCTGPCTQGTGGGSGSDTGAGSGGGSNTGGGDTGGGGTGGSDGQGSNYSGPTDGSSAGGCSAGGTAGLAVAGLLLVPLRRRRRRC